MKLILDVDQAQLLAGKVVLTSKIVNSGGQGLTFLPWNTPFDSSVNGDFFKVSRVVGGVKSSVAYKGRMVKRAAPIASDYITLESGETLSGRLEITKSYTFCNDTDYIIEFNGLFFTPDYQSIEFSSNFLKLRHYGASDAC